MKLYDIPGIKNYKLTKNGELYSLYRNKFVSGITTGRGYIHYIVYDNGIRRSYFRHRLLCMVFKPIDDYESMEVDHINGIPGDDRLENLEWVTSKENVRRFWARRNLKPTEPIILLNLLNGVETEYKDYIELARAMGVHRYEVLRRLSMKHGFIFKDYTMIKYKSNKDPFPPVDDAYKSRIALQLKKKCRVYNHADGTLKEFDTLTQCAEYLSISPSALTEHIHKNNMFITGYYELKLETDPSPFKQLTDVEMFRLKYRNRTSNVPVIIFKDNVYSVFESSRDASRFLRMPASTFSKYMLKFDGIFNIDTTYVYKITRAPDVILTRLLESRPN